MLLNPLTALSLLVTCSAFTDCVRAEDQIQPVEASSAQLSAIRLTDTSGVIHAPFAEDTTQAIALIFVSTDCPIANSFQPTLQKLHQQFAAQGIPFFMIYCSPNVQLAAVEKHRGEYQIKMPAVIDSSQEIGRLTKASVTPEAIVIDRRGEVCYRGLINNLYAGYGKKRQLATQHYLRDACQSLLTQTPILVPQTKPLGCFIQY